MVPCAEAKRGGMACVSARRRAPPRPPPFTADFDAAAARAAADRVASRRLARGPPPSTIHAVQRGRSPQRKQAEARAAARHAAEAACATEDALYDTEPTVWGSETVHGAHLVLPPPDAPRRPAGAARTGRTWRDVDALARAWERYAADTAIVRLVERSAAALPPYAAAAHAITELRLAAAETIMAGAPRRAVDDALATEILRLRPRPPPRRAALVALATAITPSGPPMQPGPPSPLRRAPAPAPVAPSPTSPTRTPLPSPLPSPLPQRRTSPRKQKPTSDAAPPPRHPRDRGHPARAHTAAAAAAAGGRTRGAR